MDALTTTFPRRADWRDALDAYVAQHRDAPFDWAAHNCASFAAGWVRQATGRALEVPQPVDAQQAARVVDQLGGLRAEVSRQLGDPVRALFAHPGDVVLVRLPSGPGERQRLAMGVCLGAVVAAPGERQLQMVPITEAEAAWRV